MFKLPNGCSKTNNKKKDKKVVEVKGRDDILFSKEDYPRLIIKCKARVFKTRKKRAINI